MTRVYTAEDIDTAGKNLGAFWLQEAEDLSMALKLPYKADPDFEPQTLRDIQDEFNRTRLMPIGDQKAGTFRVWAGGSETTVFGSREANYAFRFVHDMAHIRLKANFTMEGETAVWRDCRKRVACVFGLYSLETLVFDADTIGMNKFFDRNGFFPEDQRAFVHRCVNGLER